MINAYEYGRALFELAEEQKCAEALFEELTLVADVLSGSPEYRTLLDTPALPSGEKPTLIDEAFASCHVYVRDFIKILASKRATGELGACIRVFGECLDDSRGIIRAEARTAVPMTADQLGRLESKLSAMTGKSAVVTNRVDPEVIGGVSLLCDGSRFDGSIRARLEDLRKKLSEVTI
jgi:ATP synthase F1 delta subunit